MVLRVWEEAKWTGRQSDLRSLVVVEEPSSRRNELLGKGIPEAEAVQVQEGWEELLHIQGQEGRPRPR